MADAGVIFDLDGVLIDSEGLYYRAYSEVLEPYGVSVTPSEYEEYWIARESDPNTSWKSTNCRSRRTPCASFARPSFFSC